MSVQTRSRSMLNLEKYLRIDLPGLSDETRNMLSRLFRAHGQMCAARPWEMIIGTLTLCACLMSMSMFTTNRVCGWNYKCIQEDDIMSSDIIILTITRCLAVIYIYLQFRNLRILGSKYLLGTAAVFTLIASFVFSIAVVNMVGTDLTGLNEALPFFLLLVDLSKATALARFALSSKSQEEVRDNIGRGMAIMGPVVTLDAIVETLVIGVGTLSGVHRLETMCCFGCLSVLANYLALMTFYPACLSLVLELSHYRFRGESAPLAHVAKALEIEEGEEQQNPVAQRVKVIMSAGLVIVHIHSRIVSGFGSPAKELEVQGDMTRYITPDVPLWRFYFEKATAPSVDYAITLFLTAALALKFIVYDNDVDCDTAGKQEDSAAADPKLVMMETDQGFQPITQAEHMAQCDQPPQPIVNYEKTLKAASFIIGGDDDSSDEEEEDRRRKVETESVGVQTEADTDEVKESRPMLSLEECLYIMKVKSDAASLTDEEILMLVRNKHLPAYRLESALEDFTRGVSIRRQLVCQGLENKDALNRLPFDHYDYKYVHGSCCENVVGYMPVPVGVAGPLLLDGQTFQVPMATTEGCLVASTNRGCRAFAASGGARSVLLNDGMARAPLVRFPSAQEAAAAKLWLEKQENFEIVAEIFNSTSRFARLKKLHIVLAARQLYIRFVACTGDAMGMNMLSKGSEKALKELHEKYLPNMEILSLSGNFCTDKKPSAVNWLEGRGKSVVCEVVIPGDKVKTMLKTSTAALVDLNLNKNLIGSCMAGSIGGFNAHAANIVTAIYIATGQDPAQNVVSSNCLTVMEASGPTGQDLYLSCTMPSIEVGTVGGGTILPPQAACLEMLGVRGASRESPGANSGQLARIICATVMAGELSLMSALAAGDLVKSHLTHNRSALNMASPPSMSPLMPVKEETTEREPGTCIQA